jgi:PAS domain S-box-containing protein
MPLPSQETNFSMRLAEIILILQQVAKGDFSHNFEIESEDQFSELLVALNLMIADLREAKQRTEQDLQLQKRHNLELELKGEVLEDTKKALSSTMTDLLKSKAKDDAIISSIGDALVVLSQDGKVVLVNKAFEQILGLEAKEILGRSFIEIPAIDEDGASVPESERPIVKTLQNRVRATITNLSYKRKDGTIFPVALTVSPMLIKKKLVGAIEIFRDITKEKAIDKAKTEFVSLASHQLRTPLSAVNWYAEMLLAGDAGKISEEQKKYLQEIYQGNQRMVDLVNALLNVSRIELGTFAIEPVPTDIVELTKAIVKDIEPKVFERKLDLKDEYETGIPKINVDPKLMRMVIENLLSNAIKYTSEKGSVNLSVKKVEKNISITVADTGYGIPQDQQDKIFTKMFRASNVREKDTEGTGLGLYIIKSIVEHSGGSIRFESKEDKGTTFFISLPLSGMKVKSGSKNLS